MGVDENGTVTKVKVISVITEEAVDIEEYIRKDIEEDIAEEVDTRSYIGTTTTIKRVSHAGNMGTL